MPLPSWMCTGCVSCLCSTATLFFPLLSPENAAMYAQADHCGNPRNTKKVVGLICRTVQRNPVKNFLPNFSQLWHLHRLLFSGFKDFFIVIAFLL